MCFIYQSKEDLDRKLIKMKLNGYKCFGILMQFGVWNVTLTAEVKYVSKLSLLKNKESAT